MVQQSAYPGDDEMTVFIACVAIAWSRILFVYMLDSFYRMCCSCMEPQIPFVYMLGLSAGYNLCMLLVECTVACRMCGGLWTVAAWAFGRAANHARLIEYATVNHNHRHRHHFTG